MKRIRLVAMAFILIVSFTTTSFAATSAFVSVSEQMNYSTIINSFLEKIPHTDISIDTLEVVSVNELYGVRSRSLVAYVVDAVDATKKTAYFIIDANSGKVIEFSECSSPYAIYVKDFADASRSNDLIYYYEPMEYYITDNNSVINAVSGESVSSLAFNLAMSDNAIQSLNSITQTIAIASLNPAVAEKENAKNIARNISSTIVPDGYIYGVPSYLQSSPYVCINTSILNVIAYWDSTYSNLITGTDMQARQEIESCLSAYGGSDSQAAIPNAVALYVTNHGYYSSVNPIINPSYFDLCFEIDYGDPCLIGIPASAGLYTTGHMTTGVGYVTINGCQYAIVHDNHVTSDVYIDYSYVDYLCAIQIWS
ncbi:MAG: hypothetical protein IJD06_09960 [Clostridia bacterium]|nr:hypothetical protein [Clostridia bacterium]